MQERAFVLSHHQAVLGEGIATDCISGRLRWFDILARQRFEQDWDGSVAACSALPDMASAGAAVDETSDMVFTASGLWLRDRLQGMLLRPIVAIEAERPDLRSNDGRTHPCGAFWCSTMAVDQSEGKGSIYWFFRGELRMLYAGLTVGNAICFTADGRHGYFSDTPKGTIWRVATDPATGLPDGDPIVFHESGPDDPGGPDGAILDRDGNLYSARWGGGAVLVLSPEAGIVRRIETGVPNTTCPAFCGPDQSFLAITTARDGMTPEALAACPDAGKTFLFDAGCRGRLDPPVRLD